MWEKPENVELINHEMNEEEKQDLKKKTAVILFSLKSPVRSLPCICINVYIYSVSLLTDSDSLCAVDPPLSSFFSSSSLNQSFFIYALTLVDCRPRLCLSGCGARRSLHIPFSPIGYEGGFDI